MHIWFTVYFTNNSCLAIKHQASLPWKQPQMYKCQSLCCIHHFMKVHYCVTYILEYVCTDTLGLWLYKIGFFLEICHGTNSYCDPCTSHTKREWPAVEENVMIELPLRLYWLFYWNSDCSMKTKLTGIRMNISFIYHHHLKGPGRHNFIGKSVWHLLYSTCVTKTNPKHSDPYTRNSS